MLHFTCNELPLHESSRFNPYDKYFVVGMNPNDGGGGVIGSAKTLNDAHALQVNAIKLNYSNVRVLTYKEFTETN